MIKTTLNTVLKVENIITKHIIISSETPLSNQETKK